MNVYDFDGTILHGDSEHYFLHYVYEMYPKLEKYRKRINRFKEKCLKGKKTREQFYNFKYKIILSKIDNLDLVVEQFWDEYDKHIKKWYLDSHLDDDIIISATPEFLLKPIMERLHIKTLIASRMNMETFEIIGKLCYKEDKVIRFKELFDINQIDNFYSDSLTDKYMASVAKKAYFVKGNEILNWEI